jgi:hypothetical protein
MPLHYRMHSLFWRVPLLMVPAHLLRVVPARRLHASTSTCAVLPDPCDRTSAFPPMRANRVLSGNHPRLQYSLRPRPAPLLTQSARSVVASTGSLRARTSTCALSLDPFDRTSSCPPRRKNTVRSGNQPRVHWSLVFRRLRRTREVRQRPQSTSGFAVTPSPPHKRQGSIAMRHNCGRCGDLFRNCEEIYAVSDLGGFDLPICGFLRNRS